MIKSAFLLDPFTDLDLPPFPCPTCGASVIGRKDGLKCHQSNESREIYNMQGDPEDRCGTFVLSLVCSRSSCREATTCVGQFNVSLGEQSSGEPYLYEILNPLFFCPTIHIFEVPHSVPGRIKKPLMESFSLFWSNPGASGNSLRIAVEALLDHRGTKKWTAKDGKMPINLHHRIDQFRKTNPILADKLEAIKWLGNSGSHLEGLTKKNMETAFRLFQQVLLELFAKESEELERQTKKIIKKKGPV